MNRTTIAALAVTALGTLTFTLAATSSKATATPNPTCTFVEHEGDQQPWRFPYTDCAGITHVTDDDGDYDTWEVRTAAPTTTAAPITTTVRICPPHRAEEPPGYGCVGGEIIPTPTTTRPVGPTTTIDTCKLVPCLKPATPPVEPQPEPMPMPTLPTLTDTPTVIDRLPAPTVEGTPTLTAPATPARLPETGRQTGQLLAIAGITVLAGLALLRIDLTNKRKNAQHDQNMHPANGSTWS
jgi:LPXTG-motif cell wall-anchored protein